MYESVPNPSPTTVNDAMGPLRVYRISYADCATSKYAWASGFGPFGEMEFLHPKVREGFEAFWRVNPKAPGLSIDPGRNWPDVLGCGNPPPSCFVSARVVSGLKTHGVKIARVTEIPIGQVRGKRLLSQVAPEYHVIEVDPGISVDWDLMGVPADENDYPKLNPYPKPWPPPFWVVRKDTWSGADLFTWTNFKKGDATDLLCTEKVKQLADAEGWTNIRFTPLGVA